MWLWSCGGGVFSGFASNCREIVISKRRKKLDLLETRSGGGSEKEDGEERKGTWEGGLL